MTLGSREAVRAVVRWTAWIATLNVAWEVQLPLYTIYETGTRASIAFAIAHCSAGDVLISLACYGAAALGTRSLNWPLNRPLFGAAIVLPLALGYTVLSEWLNASVRGSWQYAAGMPTIYGVGVAPLLQWLMIPPFAILLVRRRIDRDQRPARRAA